MTCRLSIILPVLNEADIINHAITHLYQLNFIDEYEIIVIDGNPQGNTLRTITYPNVKCTLAGKGRGAQMNKGADIASGDALLFLHADTALGYDALEKIRIALKQKEVVGGAFQLGIESKKIVYRIIEKATDLRSRLTLIPYGDQAIFLRRNFFYQIGGFKEIPIMEDVELMRRIKKTGGKIKIIPSRVYTSSRRWEKEGVFYATLRNWVLIILYYAGVSPFKLKKFYPS